MSLKVRNLAAVPPLLVCCDLQNEHCQPGRRQFMVGFERAVVVCERLLTLWRRNRWPVAHLRRISNLGWFDKSQIGSDWIPQTKPQPGELTFEHFLPSAYSSAHYVEYGKGMRDMSRILAGFSLDETVLSTAVEGFHNDHRYYIAADALACKQPPKGDVDDYRRTAIAILENFAGSLNVAEIFDIWGEPIASRSER
jgi:nicotinamidase-related amidase